MKRNHTLLLTLLMLAGCSAPASLNARIGASGTPLRATIVSSATGQTLRVQPDQLPEGLRSAPEIQAILDNSNTTYTVQRNADGSLSIPLPAGLQPDSTGQIDLLLSDGSTRSWPLRFDTGPLLKLAVQPIAITPSAQVVLGTSLTLKLNIADAATDLTPFVFSWSAASSAQGPFVPISGTGASVSWEPAAAGNYYLRLEMRDTRSGAASVYTTPAAAVFVAAPERIALTEPADGRVLAGDEITLKANIPEFSSLAWLWSYSQSPVGPFTPIAAQGASIRWEPPVAGSYYLRLQGTSGGAEQVYTSSRPLVLVAAADEVIATTPASGLVVRGQSLRLSASVPGATTGSRYLWSYGSSAQGAFTAISGESQVIDWIPDTTGEFFLRVRVADASGQEKTYTSSKVLVSVRDSDDRFIVTPSPASLIRGQSVLLGLRDIPADRNINWFFAASAQAPFQAIPGQGQNVRWTPPIAGNFFLRAEVTGANQPKATYTSASALVNVTEATGVVNASPEGSIPLGRSVRLSAKVPDAPADASYTWTVGPSPVGPWQTAQTLDDNPKVAELNWYPGASGNYYVKVDMARPDGTVVSFVSTRALVFVGSSRDFFSTNPSPANIGSQGVVTLNNNFQPPSTGSYTYAWSTGQSPVGPFSAVGASLNQRFNWVRPNIPGNYYVKLDVIGPNRRGVSFLSSDPIVFVTESRTTPGF